MSYAEGSYLNLLFGVSQQAAQDRLPGQLEEQVNMVSDLVAGLRRRPGCQLVGFMTLTTSPISQVKIYNTTISGLAVVVVVDTGSGGIIRVCDEVTGAQLFATVAPYLSSPVATDIQLATLDDTVWVCNTDQMPSVVNAGAGYPDPAHYGYFYIASGGYSKTYDLTITEQNTGVTSTVSYTTPDGSSAAHAAQAVPEYIATQLQAAANATWPTVGFTPLAVYRDGAYCVVHAPNHTITISSSSGNLYIRCSNAMSIRDTAELPAKLPVQGDGLIVATGAGNVKVYYRYDNNRKVWVEDASWEAMSRPTNMPMQLKYEGGVWSFTAPTYERRSAGNADTNPNPRFTKDGITGMAAFQGRLVLMSNEYVCMSASNNPLRFYRSTMSQLADDDPIEVAAQGTLTAPYEHAVSFNKDLILFSKSYQAVVPGSSLVTPRTANVAVMTRYDVDTTAQPAVAGRSVFFAAPRAPGWNGFHEMVPSGVSDNLYVADDVTRHIPRFIYANTRFIAASSSANLLIAGSTTTTTGLTVHEYQWSNGEKVHHSWHQWGLEHPIVGAYYSGSTLMIVVTAGSDVTNPALRGLVLLKVDMQRGAGPDSNLVPKLDYWEQQTCDINGGCPGSVALPVMGGGAYYQAGKIWAFKVGGTTPGKYQAQLCTITGGQGSGQPTRVSIPGAVVGDVYVLGQRFLSTMIPTPPVIKDQKDVPVTTSRAIIHRYRVSVYNTGEFGYDIKDQSHAIFSGVTTPVRLFSTPLDSGRPLTDTGVVTIPARLDLRTVNNKLYCYGPYDMNILSIEYGYKFNQRYRRV